MDITRQIHGAFVLYKRAKGGGKLLDLIHYLGQIIPFPDI